MQDSRIGLNIFVAIYLTRSIIDATSISGIGVSMLLFIVFGWSLYCFFNTLSKIGDEPPIIKALTAFYVLLAIYGVIVVLEGKTFIVGMRESRNVATLSYIIKVSWSLLPIFTFYYYAKKGALTTKYIRKWIPVFMIAVVACYYLMLQTSLTKNEEDEVTNNGGYLILSFVPLLVLYKGRSLRQYVFMAFALLLVFVSMKRGAILCGLLATAAYFGYLYRGAKSSTRYGVAIAITIGLFGIYYVFDRLSSESYYFQERMDETMEGDTSGRDVIQGFFIYYYYNEYTPVEQLVGRGANATLELFGMYAHNDWIELGINQGLLGMMLYLFFWIAFARLVLRKNIPPDVRASLIMLFVIYFLKTFFSMSYSVYTLYSSMTLGYCIAVACDAGKAKKKHLLELK